MTPNIYQGLATPEQKPKVNKDQKGNCGSNNEIFKRVVPNLQMNILDRTGGGSHKHRLQKKRRKRTTARQEDQQWPAKPRI